MAAASVKFFYAGHAAMGLWAANAFAVGFLLRARFASVALPGIVLASGGLLTNLALGHTLQSALVFSAANMISILLAYGLVAVRYREPDTWLAGPRRYLAVMGLAAGLGPALAGGVFALMRLALEGKPVLSTWWLWWTGDALGFVVVLPVALLASRAAFAEVTRPAAIVPLGVSLLCVVAAAAAGSAWTSFPFIILLVPLMVSAVFLSPFAVAMVGAAAVLTVLTMVATGQAQSAPMAEAMAAYRFQISLAICALLPMLGSLVIAQTRTDRARVAESEQRFRRAMMDSAIGVVIVALDGRIIETNPSFADMLGRTRAELEGGTFAELTHADDREVGIRQMDGVRTGAVDTYGFEKRYIHADGSPVWAKVTGSVIRDERTREPLYMVSQIENIDARKKSEAAIAAAETRWNFALASAGQGVWDLDLKRGRVTYSSTWRTMLGYDEGELDGDPDGWLALVHPDDRERVEQADRDHVAGRSAMFEAEFRMRRKDGAWIWILDRGQVVERNPDGSVARAIGTLTDITMRREAEERLVSYTEMLADEKERLRVTLNAIGDAVICTDAVNRVTFMNPVAEKLTRASATAALGKQLAEIYRSVDEETGERLHPDRDGRASNRAVLVRADGTRCSIREVVSAIETEKGEFGGSVIVFQDFTDARTLQRELAYAAAHDALTGLSNRSSFIRTLEQLVAENPADAASAQFLFIDLDRFKAVNDTGGHAAGDALLKRVADAISTLVRPGDLVARLGGDEFAALLRACPPREAEAIANRMVGAIGTLDFNWNGRRHDVGASIGVAPLGVAGEEIDEIIARADEACYSAKASGRNCVVVFDGTSASGSQRSRKLAAAS
ncbi:MAG: PAS domain S-box protein [Rhizobiaceae bacterium]|nr:PAS domain S-box protein [Rhizobiaceae bacterium]